MKTETLSDWELLAIETAVREYRDAHKLPRGTRADEVSHFIRSADVLLNKIGRANQIRVSYR